MKTKKNVHKDSNNNIRIFISDQNEPEFFDKSIFTYEHQEKNTGKTKKKYFKNKQDLIKSIKNLIDNII